MCVCVSPDFFLPRSEVSGSLLFSKYSVLRVSALFLQVLTSIHKIGVVPYQMESYSACSVFSVCNADPFQSQLEGCWIFPPLAISSSRCVFLFWMSVVSSVRRILPSIHKAGVVPENLFQTAQLVKRLQREWKLAKIAVKLGVLYIEFHIPNIVVITVIGVFGVSVPLQLAFISGILVYFDSMGNCVIYWWQSQEFRETWRKMFSCRCNNNSLNIN